MREPLPRSVIEFKSKYPKIWEAFAAEAVQPNVVCVLTGRYPIRSGLVRVLHPKERFGISKSGSAFRTPRSRSAVR
jgi:hypothetical protein